MKNSQDVIATYMTELLTDTSVQQGSDALGMRTDLPAATGILEQHKRDQLQALLNTQFNIAPAVQDDGGAPAKTEAGPIEDVASAELELDLQQELIAAPLSSETFEKPDERNHLQAEDESATSKISAEWAANGRPEWAQARFDVLLFQVAGLTLAVPLIALGQIHPLTAKLTPVIGQAAWFMGLQPTHQGLIRTVNTALFVMPERYYPACLTEAKYLMTIAGMDWGLVVDSVRHPTSLQPEDVNWRGQRSKRPWLAGTVKSAMCALLDIPQIGVMLSEA